MSETATYNITIRAIRKGESAGLDMETVTLRATVPADNAENRAYSAAFTWMAENDFSFNPDIDKVEVKQIGRSF